MARLDLTLFGGMQARLGDTTISFPRRKAGALLAYLALHATQVHPREKLATLLWGDVPDERARHSLRQTLLTLRHVIGGGCLLESGAGIALDPAAIEVDVTRFEELAREGRPAALEQAAALYCGDLLEGVAIDESPFEEWLRTERERLRERAIEVLARLLAHQDGAGAVETAVQTAIRLLALDPLQEAVHRRLMRLYARHGRAGAALRQYQACVDVLERELAAHPEPETKRLYQELLKGLPRKPAPAMARPAPMIQESNWSSEPSATGPSLVGRAAELTALRGALEAAWQGQGHVVLIGGDVGVGKTCLVEAFGEDAIAGNGQLLFGRAHENEQFRPMGPWVDAFRVRDVVAAFQQLDTPWRQELGRLFPELGSPPPARRAAEDNVRLFEAFARAVDHLVLTRPLLLVLEDLHWADEMTLRMLVFLARRMAEWPVLVAATFRLEELAGPPLLQRCIAQLGRMPRAVSLTLVPLSQAETSALVRTLAGTGTSEVALEQLGDRIWQASEGNPFMIVEMVRAFGATPPGPSGGGVLGTPPTVRELVAARLDRLGDRARRLTAVASVIGRAFEFALLQHAVGASDAEVAEGVEELVGRRVLRAVGERLDFTHDRIREVAYERLLPPYRQSLHRTVALALESLHATDLEPYALALGRHWQASEAWDRAFEHYRRAAIWAATRAAHREAIASYELALDALRQLPASGERIAQAIDLRFDLRHSCVPVGDHARILAHLRDAEGAAQSIGDRRRLGWALAYRAHALYLAGDCAAANDAGEGALQIAIELQDTMLQEWANVYLAQVYHWLGAYQRGVERLRQNVEHLEPRLAELGTPPKQFVNTRMMLAWCLAELGEFDEARARADEALAMAAETDSAYWVVHACCGAAVADLRCGAFDAAISAGERALDVCRGRDYDFLWGFPATILGAAYALARRPAEAIPLLEGVAAFGRLPAPVLVFLAQAYLAADRVDDAQRAVTRALEFAVQGGERGWETWGRCVLGEAHARAAKPQAASEAFRVALALAQTLGMRPLVAHCHRGLAAVARSGGHDADADEHDRNALAIYRALGMTRWLTPRS